MLQLNKSIHWRVISVLLLLQNVDIYDEEDDEDDDEDDSDDDCDSDDDAGIVYRSADVEAGVPCSHKLQRCTWHSANGGGSTLIL